MADTGRPSVADASERAASSTAPGPVLGPGDLTNIGAPPEYARTPNRRVQ
jgi:hypothetical protein